MHFLNFLPRYGLDKQANNQKQNKTKDNNNNKTKTKHIFNSNVAVATLCPKDPNKRTI